MGDIMNDTYYGAPNDYRGYLMHYGVKGMHWGIRRYQNSDGSLTSLGRQHYGYSGQSKNPIAKFFDKRKQQKAEHERELTERKEKEKIRKETQENKLKEILNDKSKQAKYEKELAEKIYKYYRDELETSNSEMLDQQDNIEESMWWEMYEDLGYSVDDTELSLEIIENAMDMVIANADNKKR